MSWANKLANLYRVNKGKKFSLKDYDPADTAKIQSREHANELLKKGVARMAELQDKLYAQDRWAVLEGKFTVRAGGSRYAESLATHGLVVGEAEPEEVAAAVRASPIRAVLIDALDDWWRLDQGRAAAVLEVLRRALTVAGRTGGFMTAIV